MRPNRLHRVTCRDRCSAAKICTGRSSASAVPGAFVPARSSDQTAPSTKCIWCRRARRPLALDPQQAAGRVAHRDQQPGVLGVVDEQPPDDGHHRPERVGAAMGQQRVVHEVDGGQRALGVEAAPHAAGPRLGDDVAHPGPGLAGGDEPVVGSPQPPLDRARVLPRAPGPTGVRHRTSRRPPPAGYARGDRADQTSTRP
ncbi:hypothetical protein GCM10025868_17720 [Angustibacter aerolatus]|uniref:Uncharacterized protein n=1 Tax=Angustibacter aerolatus TaxID=1162965 RepID=A0ABQ6JI31_9ACTN|nr:hypothetical protein GCM10025868_17720 [Angustibacter aerolatus]